MQQLDISIPVISKEQVESTRGSKLTQASVGSAAERMWQDSVETARWGEPSLHVQELGNQRYSFQLRSRVNVPLLVGGPIVIEGEPMVVGQLLLKLCAQESSLRVDPVPGGFCLCVIDAQQNPLGHSEVLASEPFARAMKRLIAVQANRAQIMLRAA